MAYSNSTNGKRADSLTKYFPWVHSIYLFKTLTSFILPSYLLPFVNLIVCVRGGSGGGAHCTNAVRAHFLGRKGQTTVHHLTNNLHSCFTCFQELIHKSFISPFFISKLKFDSYNSYSNLF